MFGPVILSELQAFEQLWVPYSTASTGLFEPLRNWLAI